MIISEDHNNIKIASKKIRFLWVCNVYDLLPSLTMVQVSVIANRSAEPDEGLLNDNAILS